MSNIDTPPVEGLPARKKHSRAVRPVVSVAEEGARTY